MGVGDFEVIAKNLTGLWNNMGAMLSAFGQLWDALMSGNPKKMNEARKLIGKTAEEMKGNMEGLLGQVTLSGIDAAFGTTLTQTGQIMADKEKELKEGARRREEEKRLKAEAEAMMAIANDRKKVLDEIAKLEEASAKRKFDALTPEEQLLELTRKRVEAEMEFNSHRIELY